MKTPFLESWENDKILHLKSILFLPTFELCLMLGRKNVHILKND